jgi:hypothetical protein
LRKVCQYPGKRKQDWFKTSFKAYKFDRIICQFRIIMSVIYLNVFTSSFLWVGTNFYFLVKNKTNLPPPIFVSHNW